MEQMVSTGFVARQEALVAYMQLRTTAVRVAECHIQRWDFGLWPCPNEGVPGSPIYEQVSVKRKAVHEAEWIFFLPDSTASPPRPATLAVLRRHARRPTVESLSSSLGLRAEGWDERRQVPRRASKPTADGARAEGAAA